jgi:hypothetical protein
MKKFSPGIFVVAVLPLFFSFRPFQEQAGDYELRIRLSPNPLIVREGSLMNVAVTRPDTFFYLPGKMFRWDEDAVPPLTQFDKPGFVRGLRPGTTRIFVEPDFLMPARAKLRKYVDVEVRPAKSFPLSANKDVVAVYYPWFSERYNPPAPRPQNCENWTFFTPTIKPYDPQAEEVTEQHIRMAKDGGIDAFAISWFTNRLSFDFSYEELFTPLLENMSRIAPALNFKVHILYESHMNLCRWPQGDWVPLQTASEKARARRDAETDFNYLLDILSPAEDDPSFFVYLAEAVGLAPEDWKSVIDSVRQKYPQARFYADTYNLQYLRAFDGLFLYGGGFYEEVMNQYARMASSVKTYGPDKKFYASVGPGYDSTIYWGGSALVIPRHDGEYYQHTWDKTLAANPDGVFIATWNEWGETTVIEPSKQYGYKYIDLTADNVVKFKQK